MRKNMQTATDKGYRIIAVDDEEGIVDSLSIFLKIKKVPVIAIILISAVLGIVLY